MPHPDCQRLLTSFQGSSRCSSCFPVVQFAFKSQQGSEYEEADDYAEDGGDILDFGPMGDADAEGKKMKRVLTLFCEMFAVLLSDPS